MTKSSWDDRDGKLAGIAFVGITFSRDGIELKPFHLHLLYTKDDDGRFNVRCLDLDQFAAGETIDAADKSLFKVVLDEIMEGGTVASAHLFEFRSPSRFWDAYNAMKIDAYHELVEEVRNLRENAPDALGFVRDPVKSVHYSFGRVKIVKIEERMIKVA